METRYFFEKDGEWLTSNGDLTIDPQKAISLKDEIEAYVFLIGKHNQGELLDFYITEHIFI